MRIHRRSVLAIALALLLALTCLIPYFACAAHRSHGCPGNEYCLVCRAIEDSMLLLRLFGFAVALPGAILAHRPRSCAFFCAALPRSFARTPVASKVRLND